MNSVVGEYSFLKTSFTYVKNYLVALMFDPKEVENLIGQIKEGREELFRLIDPQIRAIVKQICVKGKISGYYEEVLESVYQKVVKSFESFKGSTWSELKAWLWRISENTAHDFINRTLKKTPSTISTDYDSNPFEVSDPPPQEEINKRLDSVKLLGALDPLEGYILVLHAAFEHTFEEIARIVKLPSHQVRRIYIKIIEQFAEK